MRIPRGSSSQHPTQMEAQPRCGLPLGAAGVCGSSFDPQELPREQHLPSGSSRTPGAASPALAPGIAALTLQIFKLWFIDELSSKLFDFSLHQGTRFGKYRTIFIT